MSFVAFPQLSFNDAYSQPSDGYYGRRLVVTFDSSNIYTLLSDENTFSNPGPGGHGTIPYQVIVVVRGTTVEGPTSEYFYFDYAGQSYSGALHFTSINAVDSTNPLDPTNGVAVDGYKISPSSPYGAIEIKELLPINYFDDGYTEHQTYTNFTAYGSGVFVYNTNTKDSYGDYITLDLGYGQYEFEYAAPFLIDLSMAPDTIYIGNSKDLKHAADGVMDEVKITSATATKTRTRKLAGSYDISIEATSPVFSEPDAKTLVLLHMDDNTQPIIDALRDPLDSANLTDSTLATIVSLRNDKAEFINYVDSLNLSGSIVEESIDIRPLSAQLFDLVTVLNKTINSAQYYKLSGKYFPSEITVNSNFKYAAVFSGDQYFIERPGLINNDQGSIEVWIAPTFNLLGDFKRRIYLDAINHAVLGKDGKFVSITSTLIELPNNVVAQRINSVRLAGSAGESNTFDFVEFATLSGNGTSIILTQPLPTHNTKVIVDYIPLSSSNDRLTLFKDENSNLIFAISASGTLYQTSRNISSWKKNEWHRVMITWKTNDKNNLDHLNMYVDGTQSQIIKYGEGFLFNTFVFKEEHQVDVNTKIIPQNIQFIGTLDKLYIGTDFTGSQAGMCRLANLRVSFVERLPVIDARGFKIDFDFDGGSKSATPETQDSFTSYLEDFNPQAGFVTSFASAENPIAGAHDLHIIVRDNFHLVRGVNNGQTERLLRELIKIIKPAEARTRITVTTNS